MYFNCGILWCATHKYVLLATQNWFKTKYESVDGGMVYSGFWHGV
jgi:hypothetical protein